MGDCAGGRGAGAWRLAGAEERGEGRGVVDGANQKDAGLCK